MAKAIMIQGTMSNVGKSIFTAALCRIFMQDGYRVAPFKAQNMALNSYITRDGLEMGRAQVVQAEAAGLEPDVRMNPVLLKPVTDMGSQVIVCGEVLGSMHAMEYYQKKKDIQPRVSEAFESLTAEFDIIVIEGAGSPAEINLRKDDFVNMGMAKMAKSPVLLVGDIDRGGVFAQLIGTVSLLQADEQDMIKGLIVNKFRGDIEILRPGLSVLEEKSGKTVVGVVPMIDIDIDDEDSLTERFEMPAANGEIEIVVIRLPKISNFTDFMALEATPGVRLSYVVSARELKDPDMIILPGTKNTISDFKWLRESGLESAIKRLADRGKVIFGICGGYQMLGRSITDSGGVEGGGSIKGMELLPVDTDFSSEKSRTRVNGHILQADGFLSGLEGVAVEGYEIHMGVTTLSEGAQPLIKLENGELDGCCSGNVYGSYLHGLFDTAQCREALLGAICREKGLESLPDAAFDLNEYKQRQYDKLADAVRSSVDMDMIYRILNDGI